MGNHRSTRWRGYTKKLTVDACRRLSPREAPHAGISTTTTPMPRSNGLRRWCICPKCNKRMGDLFQPPGSNTWACRECHGLSYRGRQRHRKQRVKFLTWKDWLPYQPLYKEWIHLCEKHAGHLPPDKVQQFEKALVSVLFTDFSYAVEAVRGRELPPDSGDK